MHLITILAWHWKQNKACEVRLLGGFGGMPPQEIFFISDLLRSFLVPWGEIARVGRPTAKPSHCV